MQAGRAAPNNAPAARRRSWRYVGWRTASLSFVFSLAFALLVVLAVQRPDADDPMHAEVVAEHVRAVRSGLLAQVVSTDHHTVKPWLQGRLDDAPPVFDLAAEGFPLMDDRTLGRRGHVVATLAKLRDRHVGDVFVWPRTVPQTPLSSVHMGVNVLRWADGSMEHGPSPTSSTASWSALHSSGSSASRRSESMTTGGRSGRSRGSSPDGCAQEPVTPPNRGRRVYANAQTCYVATRSVEPGFSAERPSTRLRRHWKRKRRKGWPMMSRWLRPLVTGVLVAAMVWAQAQAQAVVPAAGASASAPLTAKSGPRLQTPAELRDSASTPGDLRPEERVTPQIVIPLRKAAPPTQAQRAAARPGAAATSTGIDDSVARCEAQAWAQARDKCRARLTKKATAKTTMK